MERKGDVESGDRDWFYSEQVKEHFFHPKNIFTSEEESKNYKADGEGIVGSPACGDVMKMWIKVDPKTDRIKECKWSTFGSLISGEKIMLPDYNSEMVDKITINSIIINDDGKSVIVEENLKRNYSGKILTFLLSTSKYYNFSVTPNHPLPCIERKAVAKIDRRKGTLWSEVDINKIEKSQIIIKSASQLKSGDFLIFKINKKIKDDKELDVSTCKLLGYYVSDGSLPSKNRALFYFGLHEIEYLKDIEKIAKRKRWQYKIFQRNTENVLCFQLNEPNIVRLLKKHGGSRGNKNFSVEVMNLPPIKQMYIVDSYVNGDGWVTKQKDNWEEQYFISTSQENLANQLQMMLARNKIFAPIHCREPRNFIIRGKKYSNKGEINLVFRKKHRYSRIKYHKAEHAFLIPIQKIIVTDYKGKIFDIGLSEEPKIYKVKGVSVHNCASAIASTSMLSVMVTENGGMKIDDALRLKPGDIIRRLGGLPARKIHCSVLGDKALRAAINDYFKRSGQKKRILHAEGRMVDPEVNVTDTDIEHAVLEGARILEDVQQRTKAGVDNRKVVPEIKRLIEFYRKKHFRN